MSTDSDARFTAGQTALVVPVPEAEPVVGSWRRKYDPIAEYGVFAHVTVMFPFLPIGKIDYEVRQELAARFGRHDSFDAEFHNCGRFPDWLYLEPTPATAFVALTRTVMEAFPDMQPYEGEHGDPVPHLTVANIADNQGLGDTICAAMSSKLPISTHVNEVQLVAFNGTQWQLESGFLLRREGSA